jgi:hypothetical protein
MRTSPTLGRVIHTAAQDWIPLGAVQSFKPIAFGPVFEPPGNVDSSSGTRELYACYRAWGPEHDVNPNPALVSL